jgi:uncharacterized OB-fold protein
MVMRMQLLFLGESEIMNTENHQSQAAPGFESDPYCEAFPELRAFWEATAREKLLVKTCKACERAHWYPRMFCPFCSSQDTEWREASGTGKIYAFSEVLRTEVPYVLAYVRLEEGPILMTNIVDADPAQLQIDQPVRVLFRPTQEGREFPVFTPA